MIRSFAREEVKPRAAEVDEQEHFPEEMIAKLGENIVVKRFARFMIGE